MDIRWRTQKLPTKLGGWILMPFDADSRAICAYLVYFCDCDVFQVYENIICIKGLLVGNKRED